MERYALPHAGAGRALAPGCRPHRVLATSERLLGLLLRLARTRLAVRSLEDLAAESALVALAHSKLLESAPAAIIRGLSAPHVRRDQVPHHRAAHPGARQGRQIGRASCRERV